MKPILVTSALVKKQKTPHMLVVSYLNDLCWLNKQGDSFLSLIHFMFCWLGHLYFSIIVQYLKKKKHEYYAGVENISLLVSLSALIIKLI